MSIKLGIDFIFTYLATEGISWIMNLNLDRDFLSASDSDGSHLMVKICGCFPSLGAVKVYFFSYLWLL